MRNEEIYKLIERQENSFKEVIEAKLTGFKAEIKTGNDLHTYKLDELIDHKKVQNGRIEALEKETRVFRLIHRNPTTSFIIGGLSLLGLIAFFILKNLLI